MKRDAIDSFRHAQSLYVAGGLKDAPAIPSILKADLKAER